MSSGWRWLASSNCGVHHAGTFAAILRSGDWLNVENAMDCSVADLRPRLPASQRFRTSGTDDHRGQRKLLIPAGDLQRTDADLARQRLVIRNRRDSSDRLQLGLDRRYAIDLPSGAGCCARTGHALPTLDSRRAVVAARPGDRPAGQGLRHRTTFNSGCRCRDRPLGGGCPGDQHLGQRSSLGHGAVESPDPGRR